MKKLKNLFVANSIKDKCHLIIIYIISFIYGIAKEKYYYLLFNFILLFLFIKKNKTLLIITLFFSVIIITNIVIRKSFIYNNEYFIENRLCYVYKTEIYDDYQKVYIKIGKYRYIFNTNKTTLNSGDYVKITGNIVTVDKEHTFNGFNYQEYLNNNMISGKLIIDEVTLIKHSFNLYNIKEGLVNYYNKNYSTTNSSILKALVIGDKATLNEDISLMISKVGISHLFVVSGLHVSILSALILFVLNQFKMKDIIKHLIVSTFLIAYYIITGYMISIMRVLIGYVFSNILTKQLSGFTNVDKLSINASIVLIINPYLLFSYSFLLSYVIVMGIHIISKSIKPIKNKILNYLKQSFIISLSSIIITLPIILNISSDINLLSIIYNLFYIPFVSYILLPASLLTTFIKPFEVIYNCIINIFLKCLSFSSEISFLPFSISKLSTFYFIMYYLVLLIIYKIKIKKVLKIIIYLLMFSLFFITPYLSIENSLTFYDLKVGDSVLIKNNNLKNTILIDTGDSDDTTLVNDLKQNGITIINYLIITHSDDDHLGGLKVLLDHNIHINNVLISSIDSVSYKKIKELGITNIYKLKYHSKIKLGKSVIYTLSGKNNYTDVNNNSLVFELTYDNRLKFLFLGDIESIAENDLIKEVKNKKYDFIKVPHHGSITSSSIKLLESIKSNFSIAMNGYKNTYGFPNSVIIERYKLFNIYMLNTIDYGSIKIIIKKKYYQIKASFNNLNIKLRY